MTDNAKDYAKVISDSISGILEANPDGWQSWEDIRDEDGNALSVGAWLEDALDIEYTVNSRGEYLGARVLVTFGGPNAWVNTRQKYAEVYWGSESSCYVVDVEFCDMLDAMLEELWSNR